MELIDKPSAAPRQHRHAGRRAGARATVMTVVAGVLVLFMSTGAWAYWSALGTGTGTATTGTLAAPTGLTASTTTGSGTVSLKWTAPTTGVAPGGYRVQRFPSTGTPVAACDTASTSLAASATSCSDTSVPDGSYTYTVTAVYNSWTATTAPSGSVTVSNSVGTTTSVESSANPSTTNQTVTYTATVNVPVPGSGIPTGSVTFEDSGTAITCAGGNQTLNTSRQATCQVSYANAGNHTITAVYGGDSMFRGSTSSSLTQVVQIPAAMSTNTVLSSSKNPAKSGQTVTFTAQVAVSSGSGTPTGTVTFKADGAAISGSCTGVALSSGTATCDVQFPYTGVARAVTAEYTPTGTFVGSTSNTVTQKVTNGQLAGIAFSSVTTTPNKGNATPASPTCTGKIGGDYTCTVSGQGNNNASIAATVVLVDSAGAPLTYSSDDTTVAVSATSGGTTTPSTVIVAGGQSSSSTKATGTKNGSNGVTITFTLHDAAGTSYTAKLVLS